MVAKKKSRKILANRRVIKNLIAGVFSPVSASRKIQSISRGRKTRQSNKAKELESLLSQGAPVYKKALKTLDFRGISMKNQVLSRRVLDGAKFQKVDFSDAKLNGAKLNNVLADGAEFHKAELKKAIANNSSFNGVSFKNADLDGFKANSSTFNKCKFNGTRLIGVTRPWTNLKNCEFTECEMKNCNFSYFVMSGAKFDGCNLKGSSFNNLLGVDVPSFMNCILDSVTLVDSPFLFSVIGINAGVSPTSISNLKIQNINKHGILNKIFRHANVTFNDLEISNFLMRDGAIFDNCTFNNLKLHKNGEKIVQFHKLEFMRCTFLDCNFGEFLGHTSNYTECTFQNSNLSKCDLRSCSLKESTFINCNMNGVKFVRSKLTGVNFIDGTVLTNIDFQECEGMDGMSFQGLNLQGAKMIGISDPGLNACNFRDANLRGVQFDFSQIHGSDFTGADLTGSNVRVAEGSDQTVGIPADQEEGRAVDTHKTFYNIRINMLIDFYIEKGELNTEAIRASAALAGDIALREFALSRMRTMVIELDASETDKSELNTSLGACFTQRLNSYNFGQIIAGTDPQINFRTLIFYVIKYLEKQPKEFKDIYIQSLIMDSTQAYGPGGMSCAAGIVERFVTVMEQAAAVVKDTVPEKAEEYTELINIITNDPKSLIKSYQQEWFEFHKEGGPNAFAESAALDTIMNSYKDFLEQKFDYSNLRGSNKEKIKRVIMDDPNAGVNITREYIENSILFFGGRVKDNRHLNYFKMLKERFYIKDRFHKSRTRKHRGKKHKKKPTRGKKT